MTGAEFRKMVGGLREESFNGQKRMVINDVHAFREIVKELRVLARATAMDKYILVTGLRNEVNTVAVTGGHGHDLMALQKANVGFAFGVNGTDLTKD